jgi:hypothetical protein
LGVEGLENRNVLAVGMTVSPALPGYDESDGDAQFVLGLDDVSFETITVRYETIPGTGANGATPGSDYTTVSGTMTFLPGEVAK